MTLQRQPIRIALYDDHTAMRQGLALALAAGGVLEVVAQGGSADEAVEAANRLLPDVMLLDLHMPGDGLQALRRIYVESPHVKTVILSSDDSEHQISAAFSAGALGFLTKGEPLISVIDQLQKISEGQAQFSPLLAAKIVLPRGIATPWHNPDTSADLALTNKEEQILSRYAQGLTLDEISSSIGVRKVTIGAYLTNVLHKLHEQTLLERLLSDVSAGEAPGKV
jgi:two-component system, NarL family, nitrate/nitrite response regulator NarL